MNHQQPTSAVAKQNVVSTGILNRNVEAFIFDRVCIFLWAAIGCAIYPSKLGFAMLALADLRYFINFLLCYYPDGALNGRLYVKDIIPELGLRMTFRLDWYPGELLVFWIERLVIYLQFCCVMDQYMNDYELDHRILQYSSYIVFTATNVFYFLSAYPNLLQRDPKFDREFKGKPLEEEAELTEQVSEEKPEEDKTTKTASAEQVQKDKQDGGKELAELSKLKEENEKLISEHFKLNEENEKLYLEKKKLNEILNELSSELEAYNKLVSQIMNEVVHIKCIEERNNLLNELDAANATCESFRNLLHNFESSA